MPPSQLCSIEGFAYSDELLIKLSGVLRLQNCHQVRIALENALEDKIRTVYLHVSELREVDSAGLGVFVGLHMMTRKLDILFKVLAPNEFLNRLFRTTQLTAILSVLSASEAENIRLRMEKPEMAVDLIFPSTSSSE